MTMVTGPSRRLEWMVGVFIPPACREEVLGDLCERYQDRSQYIADAMRIVAPVVLSRIRRTTDGRVLLMEALLFYLSFLSAAWYRDRAFLGTDRGLLRLSAPAAIALVVLMLHDAWGLPGKQSPVRCVRGVAIAAGAGCLSQIAALPWEMDLLGAGLSMLLVSTEKAAFLPDSKVLNVQTVSAAQVRSPYAVGFVDAGVALLSLAVLAIALRLGGAPLMLLVALSGVVYQLRKQQ